MQKKIDFQSSHSTEHVILQLSKRIFNSLDEKQFTLALFIDFSKAFDMVDRKILIKKLGKIWNKISIHRLD